MRRRQLAAALAGPVLIVAATVVVLNGFVLGRMNLQHVDPLAFFFPTHCFLGEHLARGDIPLWNPHVLAGAPFAADPQSGWMYLPAMALYTFAPCHLALPWFVALNPILAGLGAYAFLRSERLSRPSATLGGLVLAVGMASSRVAVTLPFAGAIAWTMLMLAAASRCFRSEAGSARLGWAVASAACWGQVAAAHLSHGLVVGTGALVAFAVTSVRRSVREGRPHGGVLRTVALLASALPLVNLALLLPRLAYLPETNLALGYDGMERLAAELAGRTAEPFTVGAAVSPPWILGFATSPGAYLGIATLALATLAWRLRRTRGLVLSLSVFGGLCYLLSLHAVAAVVERSFSWMPFADFYVHEPARFRYGVFLVLPLLGAIGFEAWRERPTGWWRLAVPAALLLASPLVLGAEVERLVLPTVGAAIALMLFRLARRRPGLVLTVPALVAVELVVNGFVGQAREQNLAGSGDPPIVSVPFTHLVRPTIELARYRRQEFPVPPIRDSAKRFATFEPALLTERGYLESQQPEHWPLLANQRAMLVGLEDAGGYNPSQLLGTWMFMRSSERKDIKYNAGVLVTQDLDTDLGTHLLEQPSDAEGVPHVNLLDVGWLVGADPAAPRSVATSLEDGVQLVRVTGRYSRATVEPRWHVVRGQRSAVERAALMVAGGSIVLEDDPGLPQRLRAGTVRARYRRRDSERAMVVANGPGVVLIRNAHDTGWHASVNGRAAPLLRAQGFLQAVPIGRGRSVIELRYEDPWVYLGLWCSGLVLLLSGSTGLGLRRRERAAARRRPSGPTGDRGDRDYPPPHAVGERSPQHGEHEQTR
ncbi:MAG TPA: hypothetical protein VEA19_02830 [Actinomycetota bacterium]|nr:hypothetical protein [Actinomycetota bacterium]